MQRISELVNNHHFAHVNFVDVYLLTSHKCDMVTANWTHTAKWVEEKGGLSWFWIVWAVESQYHPMVIGALSYHMSVYATNTAAARGNNYTAKLLLVTTSLPAQCLLPWVYLLGCRFGLMNRHWHK